MDRAAEKGVSPFVAHRRGKTAGQPQHQPQRRHEAPATPPVPPAEPPKAAGPTRHTRPGTMLLYTTLQGAEVCITIEGACTIEFT